MYLRLLKLEILQFFRNPQFGANLAIKILTFFGFFYLLALFAGGAFLLYYLSIEEWGADPLKLACKYLLYVLIFDLVARFMVQTMPTQNIKPFLTLGIPKKTLVRYLLLKVLTHFFNWGGLVFTVPFTLLLIADGGYSFLGVISFAIGLTSLSYFNNFLNILLNGKDSVFYTVAVILAVVLFLEYKGLFLLSDFSETIFYSFYSTPGVFLIPILLTIGLAYASYRLFYNNFYLDKGLELEKTEGKTENIEFLNRFGTIGTFLNNDIRMLKRSKAARGAALGGLLFVFYGFLSLMQGYESSFMKFFTALFVSGGFMFIFGQRVPSWDSSYYPLMMTQRVPYRDYLKAKWVLLIIGILVNVIISVFYIFVIDINYFLTVIAAGFYNLGVNSYMTLLSGAFNKVPIDLNKGQKSMMNSGGKFNAKTMFLLIPQLLFPMLIFSLVNYFVGIKTAVATMFIIGIIGFLLRNKMFNYIVKLYKVEKYKAIESYKKAAN